MTARPNAREASVVKIDEDHFIVSVKEPPREHKANIAILKALAAHFKVPFTTLRLVSGRTSREKIIEFS